MERAWKSIRETLRVILARAPERRPANRRRSLQTTRPAAYRLRPHRGTPSLSIASQEHASPPVIPAAAQEGAPRRVTRRSRVSNGAPRFLEGPPLYDRDVVKRWRARNRGRISAQAAWEPEHGIEADLEFCRRMILPNFQGVILSATVKAIRLSGQ